MENPVHSLADLFEQLGLSSDRSAIEIFVHSHSPLAGDIKLANATFWTPAQAKFLREGLLNDADWAAIIDQLNTILH